MENSKNIKFINARLHTKENKFELQSNINDDETMAHILAQCMGIFAHVLLKKKLETQDDLTAINEVIQTVQYMGMTACNAAITKFRVSQIIEEQIEDIPPEFLAQ